MRWKKKQSVAVIYFHNFSLFEGILLIKSLVSNKPDWVLEPWMTNNTLNELVLSFSRNNRMIFRDYPHMSTQELNWIGDPSKMLGSASSLKISLDSFSSPYGPPWKISPDQAHTQCQKSCISTRGLVLKRSTSQFVFISSIFHTEVRQFFGSNQLTTWVANFDSFLLWVSKSGHGGHSSV